MHYSTEPSTNNHYTKKLNKKRQRVYRCLFYFFGKKSKTVLSEVLFQFFDIYIFDYRLGTQLFDLNDSCILL